MAETLAGGNGIVEKIINSLSFNLYDALPPERVREIKQAFSQCLEEKKKCYIDMHGVIPLIFTRIYYVLSLGRDLRKSNTKEKTISERRTGFLIKDAMLVVVTLLIIFAFVGQILFVLIRCQTHN